MTDFENISGQEIYQNVIEICEFGFRRAGTPIAIKAEKYVYQKLNEAKLPDVKLEEFKFTRWWAEKHELKIVAKGTHSVPSDQIIETVPFHLSGFTEPEGIVAEMVYAGNGTTMDFKTTNVKDKIVLIEGVMLLNFSPSHRGEIFNSLDLAKKYGALGAVFINNSPLDGITYLKFNEVRGWKRRLPALAINNFDGHYLKSLCTRNQGKLTIKFTLDAKTEKATSYIVIGTLPGKTDDIILVGTHTDSTFTGAIDNAGGNAGLIALAKYFAQIPLDKRDKTMIFAGWTGHEAGLIGTNQFHKMHQEMLKKITTFIMLDGFGSKGYYNQSEGGVIETGYDEKRGLFVSDNSVLLPIVMEAAFKYNLLPAGYVSARQFPVSDLPPFIFAGIPSILIIGKPIFYHTKYDTIDKCTPDVLERTAKAHVYIINKIHETPASKIKESDAKPLDINTFIIKKDGATPPHGSFAIIPQVATEGFPALFYPTILIAPESIVMKLEWDFGDGEKSNLMLTRHAYEKAGTYEVTLKAIDNYENLSTTRRLIRVIEK